MPDMLFVVSVDYLPLVSIDGYVGDGTRLAVLTPLGVSRLAVSLVGERGF